jgi:hypothetical protein
MDCKVTWVTLLGICGKSRSEQQSKGKEVNPISLQYRDLSFFSHFSLDKRLAMIYNYFAAKL